MPALQSETTHSAPALMLTQTRIIRASRARVYEAWTNPEIVMKWFGPAGMYCPNASFDVRVGGDYSITMLPNAETLAKPGISESTRNGATATGHYTQVVPNERLQFTWQPSFIPEETSLVTITLRDVDGGTELTLKHENFFHEGSRDGHSKGWAGSLDKLEALLAA